MSVFANFTEFDDFAIFGVFVTSYGDADDKGHFDLPAATYEHAMYLANGGIQYSEDGGRMKAIRAPAVIYVRPGVTFRFESLHTGPGSEHVLYCIHNKTSSNWEERITSVTHTLRDKNVREMEMTEEVA